jgi:Xaa-Pro aminopeptidase
MAGPGRFEERLESVRTALERAGHAGLALFPSPNLYYLTGFREEPAERLLMFLVTPEAHAMVAPAMYEEQILDESYLSSVATWDDDEGSHSALESAVVDVGLDGTDGTVLVDDTMFARFTLELQDVLPEATFRLASEVVDELRITKDAAELDALREAARISDAVSTEIRELGADAVGMTEREVAHEIRRRFDQQGGEGVSFEPIVGSGPNGAKPHYRHGDRTIQAGEPVILDFGTVVDGYPGDQTRTVVFDGSPPAEFETVYDVVADAFDAAVAAVEPGVEAQAVDHAARSVIEAAGYGDSFLHRTGHGLGLEVHERPYIVGGNETELRPGMVHSVEPGIYLEGRFGARIEDIVVVTEDGCERLNHSPKTWHPL